MSGFFEDDRIRRKNVSYQSETAKQDESRFKLELYEGTSITDVVEALAKAGMAIKLDVNNRVIVKK